jgi:hypothetical protein
MYLVYFALTTKINTPQIRKFYHINKYNSLRICGEEVHPNLHVIDLTNSIYVHAFVIKQCHRLRTFPL